MRKHDRKIVLRNISLIVYDFDGVLTDNKVILREDGMESVVLNRSDGMAMRMIMDRGIEQIIITSEVNNIALARSKKLGIAAMSRVNDKKRALVEYCGKRDVPLSRVLYIGNDINDLEVMKAVGVAACPSDACDEIRTIADLILRSRGGCGVVRELLNSLQAL
ncbi:MAG: HAD hydrolase family protein [Candidatus Omnitrophica bacterium]|nr:HAD hydrolase family protein [Candidatus Omnitrophota bacterium]